MISAADLQRIAAIRRLRADRAEAALGAALGQLRLGEKAVAVARGRVTALEAEIDLQERRWRDALGMAPMTQGAMATAQDRLFIESRRREALLEKLERERRTAEASKHRVEGLTATCHDRQRACDRLAQATDWAVRRERIRADAAEELEEEGVDRARSRC